MTELLVNAKAITTFHLTNVCLQGAPEYFEAFETVLQHHATLKDFDLNNCMASNQSVDLDKLKEAVKRSSCSDGGGWVPRPTRRRPSRRELEPGDVFH